MTLEEAQKKAFQEAIIISCDGSSDDLSRLVDEIYADFKIELEDAKAQGFREAIKEMGKVKGL